MKIMCWLLAIMSIPFGLFAQGNQREGTSDEARTPQSLIQSGEVTRVMIFHVPDATLTRVPITRKALLSMAGSGFEISTDIKERLKAVFAGTVFKKGNQIPDLRWGLLFYDADNREIGSVFVDKFGEYGYVNKEAGSFQSDPSVPNVVKELHRLTGDPH